MQIVGDLDKNVNRTQKNLSLDHVRTEDFFAVSDDVLLVREDLDLSRSSS